MSAYETAIMKECHLSVLREECLRQRNGRLAWEAEAEKLRSDLDAARTALEWYAEHVAGCRKISRDGDVSRAALDADGGQRARDTLARLTKGDAT